jgi:Mce-associated membrane protein
MSSDTDLTEITLAADLAEARDETATTARSDGEHSTVDAADDADKPGDVDTADQADTDIATEYAPWRRQFVAYAIDVLAPAIILLALVGIALVTDKILWVLIPCAVVAVGVAAAAIWNVVVHQGRTGVTLGKATMNIRVRTDTVDEPIGSLRAAARQCTHVIDTVPLLAGWFMPLRDRQRRTFADMIAGSVVVTTDRPASSRPRRWAAALLVATALSLFGLVAAQYFDQYRADQATAEAQDTVAQVAQNSTVALLSYQPGTVENDLRSAAGNLTGGFLDYYTKYTNEVVIPAAKEKQVDTQAEAVGSGVVSADSDNATVLVFINQTTTTVDNPQPTKVASTVQVTLMNVDGRWLVTDFKPI